MFAELKILIKLSLNTLRKMLAQLGLCSFRKLILQVKDEIRWNDEFKEQKFFSHKTTFSWAAATVNFGTKSFKVEDRKNDAKIDYQSELIVSLSSDHSPILLALDKESQRRTGLWKFNNFLQSDEDFHLKKIKVIWQCQ